MNQGGKLMNRYFLGTTTEAEEEEIGVRVIEDQAYTDQLALAEHELIEDYLEGSLTPVEKRQFEVHYLISEERIERVREIALLKEHARRTVAGSLADVAEPKLPWYRARIRYLVPAFGILLLLAVASAVVFRMANNDDSATGKPMSIAQRTQTDQQDLGNLAAVRNAEIVLIPPSTFRGNSQGVGTEVSGSTASVLFRLPMTFDVDTNAIFDASIDLDGTTVLNVISVRLYSEDNLPEARILAPRELFSPGTYQIRLVQRDSDNAPFLYTFRVR